MHGWIPPAGAARGAPAGVAIRGTRAPRARDLISYNFPVHLLVPATDGDT